MKILQDLSTASKTVNTRKCMSFFMATQAWKQTEEYNALICWPHISSVSRPSLGSMSVYDLQLNLAKTKQLFIPVKTLSFQWQLNHLAYTESQEPWYYTGPYLGHIAKTCRLFLQTPCQVRPFLTREATQVLAQPLVCSHLDVQQIIVGWLPRICNNNLCSSSRILRPSW